MPYYAKKMSHSLNATYLCIIILYYNYISPLYYFHVGTHYIKEELYKDKDNSDIGLFLNTQGFMLLNIEPKQYFGISGFY